MSLDLVNPLRPYYDAATFQVPGTKTLALATIGDSLNGNSSSGGSVGSSIVSSKGLGSGTSISHGHDFDFDIDMNFGADHLFNMTRNVVTLYGRILVGQPWEVSRLLLQISNWDYSHKKIQELKQRSRELAVVLEEEDGGIVTDNDEEFEGDSENDTVDYFMAVTADMSLEDMREQKNHRKKERTHSSAPPKLKRRSSSFTMRDMPSILKPITTHNMDVLYALNEIDGTRGIFRALNTTFIHRAVTSTLEAWLSGFISTLAGIPDPYFVDLAHSSTSTPVVLIATSVAACVITAVLAAPIDIIRTKFIITRMSKETNNRSVRQELRALKSWTCPISVLAPTLLYRTVTATIHNTAPFVLSSYFGIDSFSSPLLAKLGTLLSSMLELTLRLPLETLLRRSHVYYLNLPLSELITKPMPYKGIFGTLWDVLLGKERVDSLLRGWRVSALGVIGEWGVEAVQGPQINQEKF
ncbi:hypothetical protein NADFUDRAFT_83681 [Nadsonia fulvescens var. elongata DSM 6958]|uniref:Mitochondrial carrier n=1 Tax=Nadsonia fulvescens var. elongata DSM 6958 TaxID=857566 RepID=A0A1E3PHC1_9ASCO|nr:hypothetical protein NADFUDRAFT_83681 [Nadsonia fulvescens var. elongata DSM 6958]